MSSTPSVNLNTIYLNKHERLPWTIADVWLSLEYLNPAEMTDGHSCHASRTNMSFSLKANIAALFRSKDLVNKCSEAVKTNWSYHQNSFIFPATALFNSLSTKRGHYCDLCSCCLLSYWWCPPTRPRVCPQLSALVEYNNTYFSICICSVFIYSIYLYMNWTRSTLHIDKKKSTLLASITISLLICFYLEMLAILKIMGPLWKVSNPVSRNGNEKLIVKVCSQFILWLSMSHIRTRLTLHWLQCTHTVNVNLPLFVRDSARITTAGRHFCSLNSPCTVIVYITLSYSCFSWRDIACKTHKNIS